MIESEQARTRHRVRRQGSPVFEAPSRRADLEGPRPTPQSPVQEREFTPPTTFPLCGLVAVSRGPVAGTVKGKQNAS